MIVSYKETGWHVVTQRSHGILAAQLGSHWRLSERPSRWMETLLAIAEHDDAETELDGENLLTPTGGPLNFDMKVFDLQHCEKLSMLTQTKSRYIALLTSMHMQFLYCKDAAGGNAVAKTFLKQQASFRKAWRKNLKISESESLRIYDLLEWCDACSLLLCQCRLQPEHRKLEISTGPDKKIYHLMQTGEGLVSIDPWPFQDKSFNISFEYRIIKQLQFESSADFRKAFLNTPVQEQVWGVTVQKALRTKKKI
ncbi:MAG: DUF3891 family protein [Ginsengibacter sp.]